MTRNEERIDFAYRYSIFLLKARWQYGIKLMPYSVHRSEQEQKDLFRRGDSSCDGIKKKSRHQLWLAVDAVIVNDDGSLCWDGKDHRYYILWELAKSLGLETGYDWSNNDANHTQYPRQKEAA